MQLVLTWRLRLHPLAQDRPGAGPEQALSAQLDAGGAGKDKFRLKASFQNKHAGGAPTWPKLALNAINPICLHGSHIHSPSAFKSPPLAWA